MAIKTKDMGTKKPCQSIKSSKHKIHFYGLCSIQAMRPGATQDSGKVTCAHCVTMLRKKAA